MKGRTFFTALLVVMLLTALLTPFGAAQEPAATEKTLTAERGIQAQPENIGTTWVTAVTPALLPVGTAFDLCFTVYVQSPDLEYTDHFDIDLPDGWTVNSVAPDSVPIADGCSGALPPVAGADPGNVLYWQSTGYPPATGCGAWNGGSAGENFDFCANVTIPDDTGAPWFFPWFIEGDGFGAEPHTTSDTFGPVDPRPPAPAYDESEKQAPAEVDYGGTMTYTIVISNTGELIGAATVMTDALPAGTSYVPDSLTCTSGTCWEDGAAVYWAGQLAPPGNGTLSPAPAAPDAAGPAIALPAGALLLSQPGSGRAAAPAANPEAVLWEQLSDGYVSFASQYFPDQVFGVYSADDFDVGGTGWGIDTIFVDGTKKADASGSLPLADSLNWLIYPDAAGLPAGYPGAGGEIWSLSLAPGDPAVTFSGVFSDQVTVDLVTATGGPLALPPGTYWLMFYPSMVFQGVGQWLWDSAGTLNGVSAHMIDPAGVLLPPATWTPWGALDPEFPDAYDAAFRLEGELLPTSVTVEFQVDVSALDCGAIIDNEATIYDPALFTPVVVGASTEVTREGGCLGPQISIDPPALSEGLCPDSVMTTTLEICNGGDQELTWQVSEMTSTVTVMVPEVDVIQDGSFEAGTPNAYWTEYSLNFGTTLCDEPTCGLGTGTGPRTGAFWSWFGGIAAYEEGSVDQDVTIPVGAANLSFWLEQIVCDSAADYMEVLIDGTQVFYTDGASPLCGQFGYTEQMVDLTAYADGGVHNVAFYSEIFANNGGGSNFFVDDVVLDAGAVPPVDFAWLSEDPTEGMIAHGECMTVDIGFDSSAVAGPGDYMADLLFDSNDAATPVYTVPVTMTVWEPAAGADFDWSPMTGTVGSMVYFTATLAAGDAAMYDWDFGDGETGTGMAVSHTFATDGDFDVELTASNACAAPTAMHTITVEPGIMKFYLPIIVRDYP